MSISEADVAFALDLFAEIGGVTGRKMFGGLSLYHEGEIFAIVDDAGQIYLKASAALKEDLIAEGGAQFHKMPYFGLPDSALEDPDELRSLTHRCLDALAR